MPPTVLSLILTTFTYFRRITKEVVALQLCKFGLHAPFKTKQSPCERSHSNESLLYYLHTQGLDQSFPCPTRLLLRVRSLALVPLSSCTFIFVILGYFVREVKLLRCFADKRVIFLYISLISTVGRINQMNFTTHDLRLNEFIKNSH